MTANTEVKIFENAKKVYKAVAKEILRITLESNQQRFNIALSGGNTPKKLFLILGKKYKDEIPWERIHFWWGDERCVPPGDDESNFKMTKESLFSRINVPDENIHRIKGESNPEEEAIRYAKEIEENLNSREGNPVFDLVILGLGDDGHTASIFPDQMELLDTERICAVGKHPVSNQKRVTLTGNVINNSNRIFFLVVGENKAQRVAEIMNDDEEAKFLPAYYIAPKSGKLIWFFDNDAAAKIG